MTGTFDRQRLLVKIARKYYEDRLTQAEIAVLYNLSRQKVNRLLEDCRESGIVQIQIRSFANLHQELEEHLEKRWRLREAIVVDYDFHANKDPIKIYDALAYGLAGYLARTVRPGHKIAVNWGRAILSLTYHLSSFREFPFPRRADIELIQSFGAITSRGPEALPYENTLTLGHELGANVILFNAPGVADTPFACQAFSQDPGVMRVIEQCRRSDMMIFGIGGLNLESRSVFVPRKSIQDRIDELGAQGAVGEVNMRFFNRNGEQIESELDQRVVGLRLDEMREIPLRVAACGGPGKTQALLGALRGRMINVLVTDQETARRLLTDIDDRSADAPEACEKITD